MSSERRDGLFRSAGSYAGSMKKSFRLFNVREFRLLTQTARFFPLRSKFVRGMV